MTAFVRPSLLDNRYAVIAETSAYTYDDDDLVNYAEFLRNHGRYMSKGGYVDSSRRVRSLHRQQENFQPPAPQGSPSRSGLLATINKTSSSAPAAATSTRKLKASDPNEPVSYQSLSADLENKKKEYEKQMKSIEEQMVKAKQQEREAKRLEGDIKKEQRYLHYSIRDLGVDTSKRRYNAEKSLSKNLQEKDRIERDFIKKREKQTKQRTDHLIDSLQSNKDKDRRNLLLCNDLTKQYRDKSNQLDVTHQQLTRLHVDHEQRVQQREVEEFHLRKELSEIATALNLEAQKVKTDMKDFLNFVDLEPAPSLRPELEQEQRFNQSNTHGEKRRFSGDITNHRSTLDLKQRDAMRRIGDTKSRLETIYAKQRQFNASTVITEQDRRAAQIMSKLTDIDNRRSQLMSHYVQDKTGQNETESTSKPKTRHTEIEVKHHEDRLRHLEDNVVKNEDLEYELRKSVKEVEFQRRKKEQEVQRLKEELVRKKREDAKKVQEAIARSEKEEKDLERHLAKEKFKLDKLQVRREDHRIRLLKQKGQINENKDLLDVHVREHERLLRVQNESQSLQSLNTI